MRRRVLLVVVLILAMLIQCVVPFTTTYAEENVGITFNSNLYNAVKKALQAQEFEAEYRDATRTIVTTQSEIDSVTTLDLSNGKIDDLAGLDVFKNLTVLDLHANELTVDSNLAVLSSLGLLRTLDLSSNKLESVKSISNFKDIAEADITNQKIKGGEIITVDTSEEAESREKTVIVDLPDILFEDPNGFDPYWVNFETTAASGSNKPTVQPVEVDGVLKLKLTVAEGVSDNFKALKGLVKVDIKVDDSSSKLHNTRVEYYFVIVDQDEVGIMFKDENCYEAVKEQLKHSQDVNTDLKETQNRDLYERYYDDALILVIKKDDVYNNITSLVLHDKMIEDLTGVEQFVGVKSSLDISHNYIDTTKRIVELEENKAKAEREIIEKYQKSLDELKAQVTEYDSQMAIANENEKLAEEAQKQFEKLAPDDANGRQAKAQEKQDYLNKVADAKQAANRHKVLIEKLTTKLYSVYKKEYRLTTLLPIEVYDMSFKDILEAKSDEIKASASSVMDRISKLEQTKSLTPFEDWALRKLLTAWGAPREWKFETQKDVSTVDPSSGEASTVKENIEYPISNFFESINQDTTLDMTAYEELVYIFKAVDTLSQLEEYSLIERTFSSAEDKTTRDLAKEALDLIKEALDYEDVDKYFYSKVKEAAYSSSDCRESAGTSKEYLYESTSDLVNSKFALGDKEYQGDFTDVIKAADYKLILAHRLNQIDSSYLERFIYLPRIQKLNFGHNNIETLEGLDALSRLKELYAWHNGINDITKDIDWAKMERLEVLDLGYNQISDISPLEVLVKLKKLDVSNNLLSGRFTFNMINMEDLEEANFSYNQYNDIGYLTTQFRLRAMGSGKTVPKYLKDNGIKINFQFQELEIKTTVVKTDDNNFIEIELPLIFRQLEELDNENTSFGYSSREGLVDAKGEYVTIPVPNEEGNYQGRVTVEGRNGFVPGVTSDGIGYGTSCDIYFSVVKAGLVPDITPKPPVDPTKPVDPDDPTDPDDPDNPDKPDDPVDDPNNPGDDTEIGAPEEYGYEVVDNYVLVYSPETTVADFMRTLVDSSKYNAVVTENESKNISTGATVTITDKTGEKEFGILEVVVKGDVNGDGEVNAHDSGIIKNYINAVSDLVGVYYTAADVNGDGKVDSLDSMEVLQYRASRIDSFEKTEEE